MSIVLSQNRLNNNGLIHELRLILVHGLISFVVLLLKLFFSFSLKFKISITQL